MIGNDRNYEEKINNNYLLFEPSDDYYFDEECDTNGVLRSKKIGGSSGFTISSINLLKSILGTGLLVLPHAFYSFGLIQSTILLFVFGYFASVGLRIYSLCGMRSGIQSIGTICGLIDWKLQLLVDSALLIMCIGTAVSYFSLIGDMIPILLNNNNTNLNFISFSRNQCIVISSIVLLPLSLIKNIQNLRYTSILGLFGIFFLLFSSIYHLFSVFDYSAVVFNFENIPFFSFSNLNQINIIVLVFTCHQNLLYIKFDTKDQSEAFINNIINFCLIISGSFYILFSIVNCALFGDQLESNILNNYPNTLLFNLVKWSFVMMAIFTFPFAIAPARTAITNIFPVFLSHRTSTCSIFFLSLLISLFVKDLNRISSWIGALAGVPICYLLPGYLYYKYFPEERNQMNYISLTSIIMVIIGLLLLILFVQ